MSRIGMFYGGDTVANQISPTVDLQSHSPNSNGGIRFRANFEQPWSAHVRFHPEVPS